MNASQLEREKLGNAIEELLRNYRLTYTKNEECDDGYPLVDALTPPGEKTITLGLEEIELLAGDLVCLVIPNAE